MSVPRPGDLIPDVNTAFEVVHKLYLAHADARAEEQALRHYIGVLEHRRRQVLAEQTIKAKAEQGCGVTEAESLARVSEPYSAFLDTMEEQSVALRECVQRSETAYWRLRMSEKKLNLYQSVIAYDREVHLQEARAQT